MVRYLNVIAVLALFASAVYAYSIKYETMLYSAQIGKTKHAIDREHDAIGQLRAEWANLTRPDRVQALADKFLDMQQLGTSQIVRLSDLPDRAAPVDEIGRKLANLGLSEPTSTPANNRGTATTPVAKPSTTPGH